MIIFYWDFQSKRRKITPFITWKKGKGFWWYLNAYNWSNAISQLLKLAPHMKWISFLSMSIQASQKLQRSSKKKKRNEKKNRWIPQQNSKLRQQFKKTSVWRWQGTKTHILKNQKLQWENRPQEVLLWRLGLISSR